MQSEKHHYVYEFPPAIETNAPGIVTPVHSDRADPFRSLAYTRENNALTTIQIKPGAFSADECRRVEAIGNAQVPMEGRVELGESAYRVSHIAWIKPAPDTHWLFHRLGALFADAKRHFGMNITGFVDPIQYTVYGQGQYFDWHMDTGPGASSTRKISLTIQLSAESDYVGGALEFITAPELPPIRSMGTATIFPSYLAHRVSRIEKGVRRSLVAWACGPTFR